VKVYGACTADRAHVALIMELLEGGSLHQRIYDRCRRRMGYLEILQVDWEGPTARAA
jgi:serine/threonine protein kinase